MEMRGGFMRPPRERGGLMRPPVPLRGRNMMGMDRMRLPPFRPGLMRGGPPVPFVGRGMIPPHGRPRGMGPVMLPRPPIPPPGPIGPLGPRGMLPRTMMPPRPPGQDVNNPIEPLAINGVMKEPLKSMKEGNIAKNSPMPGPNQLANRMPNRNIKVSNRNKGNQNTGQNMHSTPHHPQPPPQQNAIMNPPPMQKHLHPIQPQMNSGGGPLPTQSHPMQHQPSLRGGRNGMNPRNRGGGTGMGRGGLMNVPQMSNVLPNRGNAMMNRGPPNLPPRGTAAGPPGRANMMGGPPPASVPYSSAPPPPPSSYAVPPPVLGGQGPLKRGGPPVPPAMQPKRLRYDTPLPANGYGQYQQHPPPQQGPYGYEAPSQVDAYNNAPAPSMNAPPSQNYNSPDYNYASGHQNNNGSYSGNAPYSSYNNNSGYSSYPASSAYDSASDYAPPNNQSMSNPSGDPYCYKAAPPIDSYGYSNAHYSNSQPGYDDYSGGYMDNSGYGAPVQDSSYGQSVGNYNNYSY